MMIKLTASTGAREYPIWLNSDHIIAVIDGEDADEPTMVYAVDDDDPWKVAETAEQVIAQIGGALTDQSGPSYRNVVATLAATIGYYNGPASEEYHEVLRRAEAALSAKPEQPRFIDIVFDGPPGPTAGRFVEVENEKRHSVSIGEWIDRGVNGLWALRIPLGSRDEMLKALRDVRGALADKDNLASHRITSALIKLNAVLDTFEGQS